MTADGPDIPWHPQFFRAVYFENVRGHGAMDDARDALRQGDVRSDEPREPALLFSTLSLHTPRSLPWYFIAWCVGWDSDVIVVHHQVLQVYFAAERDSLDVAAPGDCSSAIKPKVSAVCPSAIT